MTGRGSPAAPAPAGERIQKVLAQAGLASRREAERWLSQGRISVNGKVIIEPGTRVDLSRDHVKVDGRRLRPAEKKAYYLVHKPDGYVTTTRDPQGRPVVTDLLRGVRERVFPVGRLDYHTSGLIILTNDGDLADRLMRPASGCPKIYHVKVKGTPAPPVLKRLSEGIVIDGRRTLPSRITVLGGEQHTWVAVVLQEGRRNQIRRMFTKAGHPVLKLRRVAIGPISDRGLPPGAWRRLTSDELRRLDGALR